MRYAGRDTLCVPRVRQVLYNRPKEGSLTMTRTFLAMLLSIVCLSPAYSQNPASSAQARAQFASPPPESSTAPFIVWNDWMTEEEIVANMRDLARQGVRQIIVHPRPGLMTPYMSDDWFRMWKATLREAERLDMNVWIYDENSYPSGFAGGLVPEAMPESRGRGLQLREETSAPTWSEDTIAVFQAGENGYEDITGKVRAAASLPEGRYLRASLLRAKPAPWYGGKTYVDLMYPGVTEKFLSITLDPYRRELGSYFGNRIPGVFTDEPQLRPAGGLPWTDDLAAVFEKRWGYRLADHLPSLALPVGDWRKVRHNYYQVLLDQFIERWAKPYYDYCERNRLEFTGHYWEHEWPDCTSVPDNMAMSAWQQRPGIDILMNQYREDVHAQFGNVRAVREIASVANQLGRQRTLCEIYGAGGWDLRFEDMKRIGDWNCVLGINTMNEHLSYTTIRGARKRDHPQSFSYHEPWWEAYHVMEKYFTRLQLAVASGRQINDVLVIEPTTAAWMYNSSGKTAPELAAIGDSYQRLLNDLERNQVEYDIGCEDIMARNGSVEAGSLRVGKASYRTIVLPPFTENLNSTTARLLEQFLGRGGTILTCGPAPERIDGARSDRGAALSKAAGWRKADAEALPGILRSGSRDGFAIRRSTNDRGILFHQRRTLDDGQLLFLVNTSAEAPSRGVVESPAQGIEQWNLENGGISPYPFRRTAKGTEAVFGLPPSGSLLLFLANEKRDPMPVRIERLARIEPASPPAIEAVGPNVLTLDYLDITAGGETLERAYFYQANQFAFRQNGMPRNPWDSAVQFKDEIIRKTFPEGSGIEARYSFMVEGQLPSSLVAVVERPDLYSITCNGRPVRAVSGSWWLDRSFGKIDITALARVGENTLTLKASPLTIYHELESIYLLGNFALKPSGKGFVIAAPQQLRLGAWNEQGRPLYAEGVAYTERFPLGAPSGSYRVSLGRWYGSVARVTVNGKTAGYLAYPPWEIDVTGLLRKGENTVEVVAIGTLKNTLGPHHGDPAPGTAWPAMFQKGPSPGPPPGGSYSTVAYGLMEPFVLVHATN
jgi:hypothetical protein